jgi:hypothetical protein
MVMTIRSHTYEIWPELKQYEDRIHYIYAGIESTHSFDRRSTTDIVEEIRQAIKNGKRKIIFFGHSEALLTYSIFKIHRLVAVLSDELDASNLFFTTSSIDGTEAYDRFCNRIGYTGKRINILSCHGFERNLKNALKGIYVDTDVEPNTVKEKLFLCFNKVNREHRTLLLDHMFGLDLVNDGFYSFQGQDNWFDYYNSAHCSQKYPNIKKNIDLLPLTLNITSERTNPVDMIPDDVKYFKNTYFSIVTETLFFKDKSFGGLHYANVEDSMFLTEKTFKCFPMKHPFVLLGRTGTLKELRRIGYKTFSPYIDESYDDVDDDMLRFKMVLNEISRLCKFSNQEWEIWSMGIKEIVDYNYNYFYGKQTYTASSLTGYFS